MGEIGKTLLDCAQSLVAESEGMDGMVVTGVVMLATVMGSGADDEYLARFNTNTMGETLADWTQLGMLQYEAAAIKREIEVEE